MPSETNEPVHEGFDIRRVCRPCRLNWTWELKLDSFIKLFGFRPNKRQYEDFTSGRTEA